MPLGLIVAFVLFPHAASQLDAQMKSCLTAAGIEGAVTGDTKYDSAYQFQLVSPLQAIAIAFPKDQDEVAAALACASSQSVTVSVLGGQHSFVGYGFGNPGNLVISMAAFDSVTFDSETECVTFGGGARVGPVAKFLWDTYGRHVPHVRGGSVGMVGSFIGGGFGTTGRFLGTPTDNMVAVEYMLYNGTVVESGPGSDLLWAAQGAGSSFGIILSMTAKTWKPTYETAVYADIGGVDGSPRGINTTIANFLAVQEFALNDAPPELGLRFHFSDKFRITCFFYGDPEKYNETMQPLFDQMPIAIRHDKLVVGDFWEIENQGTGGLDKPNGGTVGVRAFYVQSLMTTIDKPLTEDQMGVLFSNTVYGEERDGISGPGGLLDLWGAVFTNISDADTSFAHGNNLWLFRSDSRLSSSPGLGDEFEWPGDADEWAKNRLLPFEESLTAAGHKLRGFPNYRDRNLTEAEWSSRLYGDNYLRLLNIKAAVDPQGMFTSNDQSIPVRSASERMKLCLTRSGVEGAIPGCG